MHTSSLKAAVAACALAFTLPCIAAETGGGEKSGTNLKPGDSTEKATIRAAAQKDYDAAMAKCKDLKGAERSTCRSDAKAARDTAMGSDKLHAKSAGKGNNTVDPSKTGSSAPFVQGSAAGSTGANAPTRSSATAPDIKPEGKNSSKP